jgi:surfeit locus 1 family protein
MATWFPIDILVMKKNRSLFRFKNYYFSPSLLPSLAFISLFPLLISLGIWQIHRGEEKHRLQMQFSEQQHANPIVLNQFDTIKANQMYSPVVAEGHFDNKHSFLLENKSYQHHIGYEVFSPFILKNTAQVILVNRGWIPQGKNRKTLPREIHEDYSKNRKSIAENITIKGALLWPQKTFSFKSSIEKKWPQRIQALTPEFLSRNNFKPFIIAIDNKQPYSFTPLWQPVVTLQASRHYAYALQWFALSITLFIAFFTSQLSR